MRVGSSRVARRAVDLVETNVTIYVYIYIYIYMYIDVHIMSLWVIEIILSLCIFEKWIFQEFHIHIIWPF